nr:hypothetical protein [Luteibacter pinisoli]
MSGIVDLHVSAYRPGGRMAEHRHDEAWFCLVVEGHYEESILGMRNEHAAGDLLYCPAHASHAQRFGNAYTRKVIFAPDDTLSGLLAEHRARLDGRPLVHRSRTLQAMGAQIVQAMAVDDDHTQLSVQSLALDVLAETGRGMAELSLMEPGWLRRVREYLHEDPARNATLADLAAASSRAPGAQLPAVPPLHARRLPAPPARGACGAAAAQHAPSLAGDCAGMRLRRRGAVLALVPRGACGDAHGLASVALIRVKHGLPRAASVQA